MMWYGMELIIHEVLDTILTILSDDEELLLLVEQVDGEIYLLEIIYEEDLYILVVLMS